MSKIIITIAIMILSLNVYAANICSSMTFDSVKMTCMEITRGHYLDPLVENLIRAITFDSSKIEALKVSMDKVYSEDEFSICSSMAFDSEKIKCLKKSGVAYYEDDNVCEDYELVLLRVEKIIKKARRDLRYGYKSDALDALDLALYEIRDELR